LIPPGVVASPVVFLIPFYLKHKTGFRSPHYHSRRLSYSAALIADIIALSFEPLGRSVNGYIMGLYLSKELMKYYQKQPINQ